MCVRVYMSIIIIRCVCVRACVRACRACVRVYASIITIIIMYVCVFVWSQKELSNIKQEYINLRETQNKQGAQSKSFLSRLLVGGRKKQQTIKVKISVGDAVLVLTCNG